MPQKKRANVSLSYFEVYALRAFVVFALIVAVAFCVLVTLKEDFSSLSDTQKFFASAGNFRCPQEKYFSKEEIAAHASENDLWIVVDNNVLDVSAFKDHPGGPVIFSAAGGEDAAETFIQFHQPVVVQLFQKFCIGRLRKD